MFWKSTLKHNKSAYRKWVHLYEARRHGVFKKEDPDKSIYCKKKDLGSLNKYEQMRKYGFWDMSKDSSFFPNCYFFKKGNVYYFSGIIASLRCLQDITILSIGVKNGVYIEILFSEKPFKSIGIKGKCKKINDRTYKVLNGSYY